MRELISRHTPDCLGIRPEPTGHHPILKLCDRRNNSCYLLEINRLGSHIFKNDQNIFLLSAFLWGSSLVAQVIYNWGTFSSTMHVFTATSFLRSSAKGGRPDKSINGHIRINRLSSASSLQQAIHGNDLGHTSGKRQQDWWAC